MMESATSILGPWSNFYVLCGSSAGALTGLMFVVITLVGGVERSQNTTRDGMSVFSTPTVVHFGSALIISAVLSAPWGSLSSPAVLIGLAGLCAIIYVARAWARTRNFTGYQPDLEDLCWFTILPLIAYGVILVGSIMLPFVSIQAMFAIAAGVLMLIIIGIRNAWDIVTYLAIEGPGAPNDKPADRPR
jgi:hypothetical protein